MGTSMMTSWGWLALRGARLLGRLVAAVLVGALWVVPSPPVWAQGAGRDITIEAMRSEKRVALVIGNSAYPTSPLRNPVNDGRVMAQTLRDLGFEVLFHENVGYKDLRRAIIEFGDRLLGGGVGLFFFAGHGLQVGGRNFMVPMDARIQSEREVEVEAIDVASVLARMETARNRLNIVILDACRDNPFGRSFPSTARGLAAIDAPAGTLIAYATAPGKLARDGEGANSLYTGELVKAMRVPGLKIEEVFKRVRGAVQRQTRGEQVSWEASSLVGDFMFTLPGVAAVTPPAPVPAPTVKIVPRVGSLLLRSPKESVEVWLGEERRLGEVGPAGEPPGMGRTSALRGCGYGR